MRARSRTIWISAAVAGALWLVSGLLNVAVASSVYATRALTLFVPTPTHALFWSWPLPWSLLALLLAGVSTAAVVFFVLTWVARRGTPGFAAAWFASVAAGALVGLAIDVIGVLSSMQAGGWRMAVYTTIEYATVGAYWGLVQGWIPALIASRGARNIGEPTPRRRVGGSAGIAAAGLVLFAIVGTLGADANRLAIVEAQPVTEAPPSGFGAPPNPDAPGTPPSTVAPTPVDRDPSWCTPEQAIVLLGTADAATGHRGQSIRLMNISDQPCVVEGYPDVAFADQNGNALNVTVLPGSSFMTTDAGAQPIEVPAGGYAIASIGWDANSTVGALVTRTLYAAQVAGDIRGAWGGLELDIVEGSTVEITAWQLDAAGPAGDGQG